MSYFEIRKKFCIFGAMSVCLKTYFVLLMKLISRPLFWLSWKIGGVAEFFDGYAWDNGLQSEFFYKGRWINKDDPDFPEEEYFTPRENDICQDWPHRFTVKT